MNRLAARFRRRELEAAQAKLLAKVLRGADAEPVKANPRAVAGDRDRLRGLPAVGGRGSHGGAIRGTRPGDNL